MISLRKLFMKSNIRGLTSEGQPFFSARRRLSPVARISFYLGISVFFFGRAATRSHRAFSQNCPARAPARQADFPILTPPYENSHMLLACSFQLCFSRNYPAKSRSVADKSAYAPPKEVKLCSRSVKKCFLFLLYQKFFKKSNRHPQSGADRFRIKHSQYIYYIIFFQINQIKIFYRPYPIGLTFLKKYDIIIL